MVSLGRRNEISMERFRALRFYGVEFLKRVKAEEVGAEIGTGGLGSGVLHKAAELVGGSRSDYTDI